MMSTEISLFAFWEWDAESPETWGYYNKRDPGQAALQITAVTMQHILANMHEFLNSGAMEFPRFLKAISIHVSVL